ncbi:MULTISPECIES: acyl-CoA dehydrogenase family protein [unclassified Curtobacterium]|uniref:acyl-CoA dehydrogenase family protein n=1 Tax=unclassified Curtobacterium TaxID=257496 RepID=UPI000DAAB807|nr:MULTISPECIES: acyl-CoA dehydrogenase family protein [unclassified Curtobacterium]PZE30064.1 acyl-CoA dehydrogenase [Curtobacterium sp. MCBD17_028]WIE55722.1 acyl-CoA dehydrogenase family protein [Curtobacterium sp. MCBD17_003]
MRLTEQQRSYLDAVRAVCAELVPDEEARRRLSRDDTALNAPEAFALFADRGLLGVSLPVADGGGGRTFTEECLLLEETARAGVPLTAYSTALTAAQSYLKWGDADQRRTIVTSIVSGHAESVTFTEPEAGSDLAAATTRASRDGDDWVLDGRKTWISFAHLARHLLVLARTDDSGVRHDGLTLFMVPADAPGVTVRPIETMGAHMVNDVFLSGVRVPSSAVVGTRGEAWRHIGRGLAVERVIIAAMSVGAAQRALDQLVAHVTTREQFGAPLSRKQAVRHRIADLASDVAVCRAYVYEIADRVDAGEEDRLNTEASMAKLRATETYKHTTLEAVQLMGGSGYGSAAGMEQQLRTAVATTIYGGANEVQREIIGRGLGL